METIPSERKENQMTVVITLNDGSKLAPSFDPEHKEAILTFYQNQADSHQIKNYIIRDNRDYLIALGGQF
jgi:hypothetical protein